MEDEPTNDQKAAAEARRLVHVAEDLRKRARCWRMRRRYARLADKWRLVVKQLEAKG